MRVREVANAGMDDPEILAFWFGEPDEVTPADTREAATASRASGETFYTQNLGVPDLGAGSRIICRASPRTGRQ